MKKNWILFLVFSLLLFPGISFSAESRSQETVVENGLPYSLLCHRSQSFVHYEIYFSEDFDLPREQKFDLVKELSQRLVSSRISTSVHHSRLVQISILPKYFVSLEEFESDLKTLKEITEKYGIHVDCIVIKAGVREGN